MRQRVQKIIAQAGLCSRRTAEEWMLCGRVTVNGTAARPGAQADPDTDCILVDGKPLRGREENVYLMLHKPRGYVTTLSDEKGRPNAAQLVADCGIRVYPVGRLDMDSEGLLLFTNDGAFANALTHPKQEVEKVYEVWVSGYYPGGEEKMSRPIVLDGYRIRPPKVTLLSVREAKAKLRVTIHEGRNRQIRRMCEAAGMRCTRLKRIQEGNLLLGDLPSGHWRYLTPEEIAELK